MYLLLVLPGSHSCGRNNLSPQLGLENLGWPHLNVWDIWCCLFCYTFLSTWSFIIPLFSLVWLSWWKKITKIVKALWSLLRPGIQNTHTMISAPFYWSKSQVLPRCKCYGNRLHLSTGEFINTTWPYLIYHSNICIIVEDKIFFWAGWKWGKMRHYGTKYQNEQIMKN